MKKIKISATVAFLVILFLSSKAYAVTGIVNEDVVYVRKEATTDSNKLTYVTKDDKVDVIEKDGEWYKVKYKNKTGYIYYKYVNVDESKVEPAKVETTASSEIVENNVKPTAELYIEEETEFKIIPNIVSSTIYKATEKSDVSVLEQMGEWSFIKVKEKTGWVRTGKIKEENAIETQNENKEEDNQASENSENENNNSKKAYVAYDMVNLRKSASTSSKSLAKLKLNNEVSIIKEENSTWTKVQYGDIVGFVSTSLLSEKKVEKKEEKNETSTTSRSGEDTGRKTEEEKTEAKAKNEEESKQANSEEIQATKTENATSSKSKGQEIAEYAKKFLGKKYVYGGTSPSSGFDCSGLTYYVYKQFGYTLNRSASGQASNGRAVSKSELQPGDLVIFKNHALTKIGHVGIYIGDNKMIHASEPGVGVIITDIDSKAYKYPQRYATSRRIVD